VDLVQRVQQEEEHRAARGDGAVLVAVLVDVHLRFLGLRHLDVDLRGHALRLLQRLDEHDVLRDVALGDRQLVQQVVLQLLQLDRELRVLDDQLRLGLLQAETTLINFTVTEKGLEDQLLALVVNKERPDLEETKTQLIIQNTEFTIKLKQLEDDLLYKLAVAEGDITEDVVLIESLEESKRVATEINIKVAQAKETEVDINENRNKYRPVAARGAMLFFLLNSLNKIHAFYQFSLNAFVTVFGRGLDLAPGGRKKKKLGGGMSFRSIVKRATGEAKDFASVVIAAKKAARASREPTPQASETGEPE